jgi:Zn-dependent protease
MIDKLAGKYHDLGFLGKLLIFLVTGAISLWVLDLFMSLDAAVCLVAATTLHEFGHWLAFRLYGYTGSMVFLPLVGAATVVKVPVSNGLTHHQHAMTAFAGPLVNLLLAGGGYLVAVRNPQWHDIAMMFAVLNLLLASFNLIPFWIFDGRKIADAIFASVDEQLDRVIFRAFAWASIALLIVAVSLGKLPFYIALIILGASKASKSDNPDEWRSSRAMSWPLAKLWTIILITTLIGSWGLIGILPDWQEF